MLKKATRRPKTHRQLGRRGAKIYIQDLGPRHFRIGALCLSADKNSGSIRKRMSKLPREDPEKCLWRARMGKDGKHLYFAVRMRVKNSHYKGTGIATGNGYHYQIRWKTVYDRRTGKAFDAKNHMSDYLRGKLS